MPISKFNLIITLALKGISYRKLSISATLSIIGLFKANVISSSAI